MRKTTRGKREETQNRERYRKSARQGRIHQIPRSRSTTSLPPFGLCAYLGLRQPVWLNGIDRLSWSQGQRKKKLRSITSQLYNYSVHYLWHLRRFIVVIAQNSFPGVLWWFAVSLSSKQAAILGRKILSDNRWNNPAVCLNTQSNSLWSRRYFHLLVCLFFLLAHPWIIYFRQTEVI